MRDTGVPPVGYLSAGTFIEVIKSPSSACLDQAIRLPWAMSTEEQILERMPVWDALSELFLDDKLSQEDCQRMASVLARSRYSVEALQEILRHEVYPACSLNLISVAGAWGAWGEDWIRERIAPRYNQRPLVHLPAFQWRAIEGTWSIVKTLLREQRQKASCAS